MSFLSSRPNHIPIPPSPFLNLSYSPSPGHAIDDPFDSPMLSPALTFYTAPSSPIPQTPSPKQSPLISNPLLSPPPPPPHTLHISIPQISQSAPPYPPPALTPPSAFPPSAHLSPSSHFLSESIQNPVPNASVMAEDSFPDSVDLPADVALENEVLNNTLEKIYLFSRSKAAYHRIFIANSLPDLLEQVTPHEAIEYVLPLLNTLAMDEDDTVKEAFSSRLVTIIWWFFTRCQVVPGDDTDIDPGVNPPQTDQDGPPRISVQAFTPILGTLLLSPNGNVGGAARYAVVSLLERIKRANEAEDGKLVDATSDTDLEQVLVIGLFSKEERTLFEKEILYQVVIGMGRLDEEDADFQDANNDCSPCIQQLDATQKRASTSEPNVQVVVSNENGLGCLPTIQRIIPEEEESFSKSPQRSSTKRFEDNYNPYFPPIPPTRTASDRIDSPASVTSSGSSDSTPGSTTGTSASSSEEVYLSPSQFSPNVPPVTRSSSPRPSPTLLSCSRFTHDSPYHSRSSSPLSSNSNTETSLCDHQSLDSASSSKPLVDHDAGAEYVEEADADQAAVGRLSSMSLMAAVAASGCLSDTTKAAFVKEVERVSQDPVYWVRREACFALGALAKVVPEEIVHLSLIPLLQNLVSDPVYHVRHSSLYALPAILSRLPYKVRKKLALDVIVPMSMDESADVRTGVLEALGEIIYTFHNSAEDNCQNLNDETVEPPPEELLGMFLGRTQDRRIIDGQQPGDDKGPPRTAADRREALDAFFADPSRPLICAFNFPAVVLTLGRSKWPVLRETYISLTRNNHPSIQRTLAASLGELARIIGPENAQIDLIKVWWDVVKNDEDDIRMKAIECLSSFVSALGKEGQVEVLTSTLQTWESGTFRGWRERAIIARSLGDVMDMVGQETWNVVVELETVSLLDSVNAVREAGIYALPKLWTTLKAQPDLSNVLSASLNALAHSASSRKRMTFIACQQALSVPVPGVVGVDDAFCESVAPLVVDDVLDVRISLARLIGILCIVLIQQSKPIPQSLRTLVSRLSQDDSSEVKAYVTHCLDNRATASRIASTSESSKKLIGHNASVSTFSRPPLSRVLSSSEGVGVIGAFVPSDT